MPVYKKVSLLGSMLFLLYINDIVTDNGSNICLFADDTSLYIIVDNPNTAAEIINSDLVKISNWARAWFVDFNCWFSFAQVFQWCYSTSQGSPGVGRNTFLSSPHLCFIIVFICDLFVSRNDPLMN